MEKYVEKEMKCLSDDDDDLVDEIYQEARNE